MKQFSARGFRIARSSFEIKLVYTFFLVFMLIGFATIAGYEFRHIGFGLQEVMEHYRGSAGEGMKFEKTFLELLQTTHFHAFIMGLVYLTLAHIFAATRVSGKAKGFFLVGGFLFTLLDLIGPWFVRYASPHFSSLMIAAWIGEWVAYMGMTLIPLYDMWLKGDNDDED